MQIKKLKTLFASLVVLFFIYSCTSDVIVPDPPDVPEPPHNDSIPDTIPDTIPVHQISYSKQIQPVFTGKCMPCHAAGAAAPTLVSGKSYQSLMSISGMVDTITPGNSTLYKEMKPGGGMSNYCKKADADSVYKWIDQGAKNN
jgi:hypothetical protein